MYEGSCHCGAVTFTVEGEAPTKAISCNCSYCRRKGFLMTFVSRDQLTITAGQDRITEYRFNKHNIAHAFCPTCGVQPFGRGTRPDGSLAAMINLRAVPSVDIDALEIENINGASF